MLYAYENAAQIAVEALLRAAQRWSDGSDQVTGEHALLALLNLPMTQTILPRVLRDPEVWAPVHRKQLREQAEGGQQIYTGFSGQESSRFIARIEALATEESSPRISEWHVARALEVLNISAARVNHDLLCQRVSCLLGRVQPNDDDLEKVWCFCDTNLFLQYQLFTEVDWCSQLEFHRVVLVVPTVAIRELDRSKTSDRERLRKRARQVLPRFWEITKAAPSRRPASVRTGVELLLQAREPAAFSDGLDPAIADDRLIAAALEFRWTFPGTRVVVLSGDTTVLIKAREWQLDARTIPTSLELQHGGPDGAQ